MKIFQMNDCDWYAADTAEEAVQAMADNLGYKSVAALRAENDVDPVELTDEDMDRLKVRDTDENEALNPQGETHTFREQLAEMIENDEEFPCFFASTEY